MKSALFVVATIALGGGVIALQSGGEAAAEVSSVSPVGQQASERKRNPQPRPIPEDWLPPPPPAETFGKEVIPENHPYRMLTQDEANLLYEVYAEGVVREKVLETEFEFGVLTEGGYLIGRANLAHEMEERIIGILGIPRMEELNQAIAEWADEMKGDLTLTPIP